MVNPGLFSGVREAALSDVEMTVHPPEVHSHSSVRFRSVVQPTSVAAAAPAVRSDSLGVRFVF